MKVFSRKLNKRTHNNKGMTLVEMIVSFALLSIFVVMSTIIISNVVALYYRVRGESYARQVGDIVMKKITSEIAGAEYSSGGSVNPVISNEDVDGNALIIVDSTDTKIKMYAEDGILKIYYYRIDDQNNDENDRNPVIWNFDKKMYNGYYIESLDFAWAASDENLELASPERYNISNVSKDYPANVMAVYMRLKSGKYGTFNICRYVKIYNMPEE